MGVFVSALLVIGEQPSQDEQHPILHTHLSDEIEAAPSGTILRVFDYSLATTEHTPRPSHFQHLRHRSDPLADSLVDYLDLAPGRDAFAALETELGKGDAAHAAARAFWMDVNREPPPAVTALPSHEARRAGHFIPPEDGGDRFCDPCLSQGQAVFWRYSGPIFESLGKFSLAGGFSAPKLNAAMAETGYLTSVQRDATHKRLLETTLHVLDSMSDMAVGTGRGWRSSIRVRLLHAQVRRKIRAKKGKLNIYDEQAMGVPINQADLLTVLGAFMIPPIWSMRRAGIELSGQEKRSYQLAWRHIGFYLGIEPALLEEYYGHSFERAEACFAALAFDAFPQEVPEDGRATSTYRILSSMADRPPRGQSIGYHLEYSRVLLGPALAAHLAIPRGSLLNKLAVHRDLAVSWSFLHFGRHYPRRGWEQARQAFLRQVIELVVVWQLGERRTTFAWRPEERRELKLSEEEGEEPGIEMGPHVGRAVRAKWKWLLAEMLAVVVGATAATGLAGWGLYGLHIARA